jgi:RNA polymerase sigma-70 factor (ECF subfamily)
MTSWGDRSARTEAFEALAAPHLAALYRFALRRLRSPQVAEDLVQEASLKAYLSFDQFEAGTDFRGWMFRILINTIHDWHRKAARAAVVSLDQVDRDLRASTSASPGDLDPENRLIASSREGALRAALAGLPPKWQTIILLSFVEGFSYKEMARVLDCPVGTVMSRLYRARQELRRRLAHWLDDDAPRAVGPREPRATVTPLDLIRSRLKSPREGAGP